MTFSFSTALQEHIRKKSIHGIIIEVASCDNTDLEVTELHTHFVTGKQAALFVKRKNFKPFKTDFCMIYLPNYRLSYAETVAFDLRGFGPFKMVKVEGVTL